MSYTSQNTMGAADTTSVIAFPTERIHDPSKVGDTTSRNIREVLQDESTDTNDLAILGVTPIKKYASPEVSFFFEKTILSSHNPTKDPLIITIFKRLFENAEYLVPIASDIDRLNSFREAIYELTSKRTPEEISKIRQYITDIRDQQPPLYHIFSELVDTMERSIEIDARRRII